MIGNEELRANLTSIVKPSERDTLQWLDHQIEKMKDLNEKITHNICLHIKCSNKINELSCFTFALDIGPDSIRLKCSDDIFPGTKFIQFLLEKGHLIEVSKPNENDIVIYYNENKPTHAGKCVTEEIIISKWGAGATHVWKHGLWEVPEEYGNNAHFYKQPFNITNIYLEWAEIKSKN